MMTASNSPSRPSWRPHREALTLTLLTWAPMLLWFAAFRPGFMSADSLEIYRQATKGGWQDIHPPLYTTGMWLSHALIGSPSLLTLGQSLFLAAGIAAVALAMIRFGARRNVVFVVTGIVAVLPQVGAFSISLWKDIPYTASFLFVGARVLDLVRARMADENALGRRVTWSLAAWSGLAVALRQNGVLLALGLTVALVVFMWPWRKRLLLVGLVPLVVLGVLKVVVYRVLDVTPTGSQPSLAILLHDIAADAALDPASLDAGDRALMERIAPFEVWRQGYEAFSCVSANWEIDPRFHWTALDGHSSEVIKLWVHIVEEHPLLVARNRLCVGAIAWRPDTNRGVLYTVSRGIDANQFGLHTAPLISGLTDPGRTILDKLDEPGIQAIAWRAPGWIYLAYVAIAITARRRRSWTLLIVGLPLLMLQLAVFPVNPAQDARYMFPGLILAVLLLPIVTIARTRPTVAPAAFATEERTAPRADTGSPPELITS